MSGNIACEQAGVWLAVAGQSLTAAQQQALAAHVAGCPRCTADAAALAELQVLLAHEESPSPLARTRFLAALRQETATAVPTANPLLTFFRDLFQGRPLGAFSYSAALLTLGLVAGQLLPPHSLGVGPQAEHVSAERLVQLCPLPKAPQETVL